MKSPRLFLSFCASVFLAASGFAANIVWVSDMMPIGTGTSDRDGGTDGIFGPGTGPYPDQGFVDLLTSAGHTVTRFNPSNSNKLSAEHIAQLNGYDLIILGRSISSGNFQGGGDPDAADNRAYIWNTQITTPIISTNPYLTRSTHLGWFTGATLRDQVNNPLTFSDLSDPVTSYIVGSTAITGATMNNSYTQAVLYPNGQVDIRGTSLITDPPAAGAQTIATVDVNGTPAHVIVAFPEGTSTSNGVLAGYRMQFLAGNRESATAGDAPVSNVIGSAGFYNLTADGEELFLRAIEVALNNGRVPVVPEPASAVLILATGSLLLRRRRVA